MPDRLPEVFESAKRVCEVLWGSGRECYAVGGAVRDWLMGKEPHDVDLTTNARPEEVMELAERAGCRAYPTGVDYGTVTVTCDGVNYHEVTTYRGEKYSRGSRKPTVSFSDRLEDDLKRRDFTVNALVLDLRSGEVIDRVGGLEDLRRGVIRAIGDPEQRFREDPLRIVRMCRFAGTLGFTVDSGTMEGARRAVDELRWVAAERIRDELRKGFEKAEKPSEIVRCLLDAGALNVIAPEVEALAGHEQPPPHAEDALEHTLCVLDRVPRDYALRMAALLHDVAKPATRQESGPPWYPGHAEVGARMAEGIMRRLRSRSSEVEEVSLLIREHMLQLPGDEREARKLLVKLGERGLTRDLISKLLELKRADIECTTGIEPEKKRRLFRSLEVLAEQLEKTPINRFELSIDGEDLVDAGVEPKALSWIFKKLLEWVAEDPSRNEREQLIKRAVTLARSIGAYRASAPSVRESVTASARAGAGE